MKKLIDAEALREHILAQANDIIYSDGLAAELIAHIDALPDAGCARGSSSVSQYCPIAESAGREEEALRVRVKELEKSEHLAALTTNMPAWLALWWMCERGKLVVGSISGAHWKWMSDSPWSDDGTDADFFLCDGPFTVKDES